MDTPMFLNALHGPPRCFREINVGNPWVSCVHNGQIPSLFVVQELNPQFFCKSPSRFTPCHGIYFFDQHVQLPALPSQWPPMPSALSSSRCLELLSQALPTQAVLAGLLTPKLMISETSKSNFHKPCVNLSSFVVVSILQIWFYHNVWWLCFNSKCFKHKRNKSVQTKHDILFVYNVHNILI